MPSAAEGVAAAGQAQQATLATYTAEEEECSKKFWSPSSIEELQLVEEATAEELAIIQRLQLHTHGGSSVCTALHYAAAAHKPKLVAQLLQLGADPNAATKTDVRLPPLHLACVGRVKSNQQMKELLDAAGLLLNLADYAKQAGPACSSIVSMLLEHGATVGDDVTPLHLLACWSPAGHTADDNAAVGKGGSSSSSSSSNNCSSRAGTATAGKGSSRRLDGDAAAAAAMHDALEEQLSAARIVIAAEVAASGCSSVDAAACNDDTPLTLAARAGAFDMARLLLQHGADSNKPRALDAARPLDVAVFWCHLDLAHLLLEHGAEVRPGPEWQQTFESAVSPDKDRKDRYLHPDLLLLNAVISNCPGKARLVEILLQRGVALEEVKPQNGETALTMAVMQGDVQTVQLLVAAGANLEVERQGSPPSTPLVNAAVMGKLDILQILLDAGADFASYISESTGYDLVQTTAKAGHFEAVVKLVEAGASWWLPKDLRLVDGFVYYVPQILRLNCNKGSGQKMKLSFIEGRLKLAEKLAKQRRERVAVAAPGAAAAATAPGSDTGNSEQQQAAAAAVDLDALAAEIEAAGGSSSSNALQVPDSSCKKSKKQEKLKKRRAKQQQKQQQQQRSGSHNSREVSEEEEDSPAGSAAVAGHLSELGDVSLNVQQRTTGGAGSSSSTAKQLQTRQQDQQQEQPQQQRQQQQHHVMQKKAAEQQQKASTLGTLTNDLAPAIVSLKQVHSQQQSHQQEEEAAASLQQAPAGINPAVQQAAAAAPSVLQSWRGSLNPIFMYSRGSSSSTSVSPAAAAPALPAPLPATAGSPGSTSSSAAVHCAGSSGAAGSSSSAAVHCAGSSGAAGSSSSSTVNCAGFPGAAGSSNGNSSSKSRSRKKCIVCMEGLREVLLLPCKHLVLCSACVQQLEGRGALDNCPYCRQTCSQRVRVHAA